MEDDVVEVYGAIDITYTCAYASIQWINSVDH